MWAFGVFNILWRPHIKLFNVVFLKWKVRHTRERERDDEDVVVCRWEWDEQIPNPTWPFLTRVVRCCLLLGNAIIRNRQNTEWVKLQMRLRKFISTSNWFQTTYKSMQILRNAKLKIKNCKPYNFCHAIYVLSNLRFIYAFISILFLLLLRFYMLLLHSPRARPLVFLSAKFLWNLRQ